SAAPHRPAPARADPPPSPMFGSRSCKLYTAGARRTDDCRSRTRWARADTPPTVRALPGGRARVQGRARARCEQATPPAVKGPAFRSPRAEALRASDPPAVVVARRRAWAAGVLPEARYVPASVTRRATVSPNPYQ